MYRQAQLVLTWWGLLLCAVGKLMTVFSAPDYPQFMADDTRRFRNKGAVAVLSAPTYTEPVMKQFEAVLPRPDAVPYYDLHVGDSDDEPFEPAASEMSGMTDVRAERAELNANSVASLSDAEAPDSAGRLPKRPHVAHSPQHGGSPRSASPKRHSRPARHAPPL